MKKIILNVAEKPSIAKILTDFLKEGEVNKLPSKSIYNPVFSFERDFKGSADSKLLITSVTGHIQEIHFDSKYKDWNKVNPLLLIESAEIYKRYGSEKENIVENLKILSRQSTDLVLWLDCDREGEAIAFQVIDIVQSVKPNIQIHRARFSAATRSDILRAYKNLVKPDKGLSDVYYYQLGCISKTRDRSSNRGCIHQASNTHSTGEIR